MEWSATPRIYFMPTPQRIPVSRSVACIICTYPLKYACLETIVSSLWRFQTRHIAGAITLYLSKLMEFQTTLVMISVFDDYFLTFFFVSLRCLRYSSISTRRTLHSVTFFVWLTARLVDCYDPTGSERIRIGQRELRQYVTRVNRIGSQIRLPNNDGTRF